MRTDQPLFSLQVLHLLSMTLLSSRLNTSGSFNHFSQNSSVSCSSNHPGYSSPKNPEKEHWICNWRPNAEVISLPLSRWLRQDSFFKITKSLDHPASLHALYSQMRLLQRRLLPLCKFYFFGCWIILYLYKYFLPFLWGIVRLLWNGLILLGLF